jgi:hypothetical protein
MAFKDHFSGIADAAPREDHGRVTVQRAAARLITAAARLL